jgi:hypothetical protein
MRNGAATLCLALWWVACAQQGATAHAPGTLLEDVIFDRYTPLSRGPEVARRALPPLTVLRRAHPLARAPGQVVDLANERFTLYVPPAAPPPSGYGLLVFVPPWEDATKPSAWRAPLDQHRLIFVAATRSGNEAPVLDRRLPLALLAWENVRARYPIDPARVFIAGLSGGSRTAEITALAYPDVFRGVLLNGGSDPFGATDGIYLPPADLFAQFQKLKVVFATGESDEQALRDDEATRAALKRWCVFDVEVKIARGLAHEPLDRRSLERALSALDSPSAIDAPTLAQCNARIDRELSSMLAEAGAAIESRDRERARALLKELDGRYAGLAATAIQQLDARMRSL